MSESKVDEADPVTQVSMRKGYYTPLWSETLFTACSAADPKGTEDGGTIVLTVSHRFMRLTRGVGPSPICCDVFVLSVCRFVWTEWMPDACCCLPKIACVRVRWQVGTNDGLWIRATLHISQRASVMMLRPMGDPSSLSRRELRFRQHLALAREL